MNRLNLNDVEQAMNQYGLSPMPQAPNLYRDDEPEDSYYITVTVGSETHLFDHEGCGYSETLNLCNRLNASRNDANYRVVSYVELSGELKDQLKLNRGNDL